MVYVPGFSSGKPHSGESTDGLCIPGFSSGKPHSGKGPDGLVGEVQGIPRRYVNHFWYDLIVKYKTYQLKSLPCIIYFISQI